MPHKILVVDDEPDWEDLVSQYFRKQIRRKEWELLFAANGKIALEKIKEYPDIGVILLDINMPEMDGLTFLAHLNRMNIPTMKAIVVTAYGDMENIRAAMNGGAFDFITKPVDFKDLEATINKTIIQIDFIVEALKSRDELVALNRDLKIAARLQQAMLPHTFPPYPDHDEFEIHARMEPAKKIGGDFYDFFFITPGKLVFAVGDVAGKGIPAALCMAKCCTLLKSIAVKKRHAGKCLEKLNTRLQPEKYDDENLSVTLFCGVLDVATGEMQYGCAGHHAPYIIHDGGKVEQLPQIGGFPLAYFEESPYQVHTVQLQKGDTLAVYSDGVSEAENSQGIQFEEEKRLGNFLAQTHGASLEEITDSLFGEIETFASGEPQADDITLLTLRYHGNE
ncbi:MAG: SpoIIE family protein phosphatase [bacterium]|nr:SpoIIE family protein phosphatase [bacterium]